jgi:hypothetical protein
MATVTTRAARPEFSTPPNALKTLEDDVVQSRVFGGVYRSTIVQGCSAWRGFNSRYYNMNIT